jgi:hypothetical protein
MTGMDKKSITRIVGAGYIKVLAVQPKYLIPKVYFLEYLASPHFIEAWSNSEDFIKVLDGFAKWQQQSR